MCFIELRNIVAPLHSRIKRDHVPEVEANPVGVGAIDNSLHFLAVLRIHLRPQHILAGFSNAIPVLAGIVSKFELVHLLEILNFWRQQVSMLEANLRWSTLEVNYCPAIC